MFTRMHYGELCILYIFPSGGQEREKSDALCCACAFNNSDLEDESSQIINKMSTIDTLNFSNDSHQEIYERNKVKIIPFVKK